MAMNRIQFQRGLSLPGLQKAYGTEAQCEQALVALRWPDGFRCPCCDATAHCVLRDGARQVFPCNACRPRTSSIAATVFHATKLSLTNWLLAIYLISEAKTGFSALALKRQWGFSYPTAWLMHHNLMAAMAAWEERQVLEGKVLIDDANLGGERSGGKPGRSSENEVPAAVSLTETDHPAYAKLSLVPGVARRALADWAGTHLAPTSTVFSDGLACFKGVVDTACTHHPVVAGDRKPKDLPEFCWRNTVVGNLKTSLSGCYHAFHFRKYGARYLAAFCYRFNRRFALRALLQRLRAAAAGMAP